MTFTYIFKSQFYKNSYTPPVDLSQKSLKNHLVDTKDGVGKTAQTLISDEIVSKVLKQPLCYTMDKINSRNETLKDKGFKLLSVKPFNNIVLPYYSVLEHPKLPGYVLKTGARRFTPGEVAPGLPNDLNERSHPRLEESLMRIAMAERIRSVAQKHNIEVVIPEKKLVPYTDADQETDATRKYCILAKKIDILSSKETLEAIKEMTPEKQKELARDISTLVREAGIIDTGLGNLTLSRDGKIAVVDTEPFGLMVKKADGIFGKIFQKRGHSVEKSARIGLFTLLAQVAVPDSIKDHEFPGIIINTEGALAQEGLEPFFDVIKEDYSKISKPVYCRWKIAFGFATLGIFPLTITLVTFGRCAVNQIHLTMRIIQRKDTIKLTNEQYKILEGVPFKIDRGALRSFQRSMNQL